MSVICLDFGTAWCKAVHYGAAPGAAFHPEALRVLALGRQDGVVLATALRVMADHVRFGPDALTHDGLAKTGAPYLSFKALLAAPDLARVLEGRAPARYDPHGHFVQRDLLVLYLGFALHRMRGALGLDAQAPSPPFRYTYPFWGLGADRRTILGALFSEAAFLAQHLGGGYDDPAGLAIDAARTALEGAKAKAGAVSVAIGAVFEAGAAVFSRLQLDPKTAQTLLVVDIGAGTSDFGAFSMRGGQLFEIRQARKTIDLAGDTIDNALLNLVIERAKHVKGATAQGVLWRELSPHMRRVKESLFTQGQASLRCAGAIVQIRLAELERQVGYRAFTEAVTQEFVLALQAVDAHSAPENLANGLTLVLSGGGGGLPFLARMAAKARPKKGIKFNIVSAPLRPDWCMDPCFDGQLAPVFPQLAVAIGGAMAAEQFVMPSAQHPSVTAA